jgi:hypothetical protein
VLGWGLGVVLWWGAGAGVVLGWGAGRKVDNALKVERNIKRKPTVKTWRISAFSRDATAQRWP